MPRKAWNLRFAVLLLLGSTGGSVLAKLPAPTLTPEQQQAAAAKKEQAAVQQAKEKQQLTESMDRIAERWRTRAGTEGWKTNPPTPVAAQSGAPAQGTPPQGTPPAPGAQAAAQPGASTTPPAPPAAPALPIRSEKFGTAPPSADVKTNTPSGTKLNERIYKNPVDGAPHKKPEK
jgi:hypothetical protein